MIKKLFYQFLKELLNRDLGKASLSRRIEYNAEGKKICGLETQGQSQFFGAVNSSLHVSP